MHPGNLGEHKPRSWSCWWEQRDSHRTAPVRRGQEGFGGGSAAPPCAWSAGPRTQSGNRARTRPRNLEPGAVGGCRWDPSNPDPAQDETGNPLLQNSTGIQFPWRLQTGHAAPDPKGDAGRDPPAPDHRSQRRWDPPLLWNSTGICFPWRCRWDPPAPEFHRNPLPTEAQPGPPCLRRRAHLAQVRSQQEQQSWSGAKLNS